MCVMVSETKKNECELLLMLLLIVAMMTSQKKMKNRE